jgi:hypothetical protein
LHQQVRTGGGRTLRCREHELQRRFVVGLLRGLVGDTAPQVDDLAALDVQTEARPHVTVLFEVAHERVADTFESGLDDPIHVHLIPSRRSVVF